jgi:hypothetical protein
MKKAEKFKLFDSENQKCLHLLMSFSETLAWINNILLPKTESHQ